MHRRDFLTAATAAGVVRLASAQTPPPKRPDITSSVMVWTIKGSLEEKLATAARAGLQSVEFVSEHTRWSAADRKRVKRLVRSYRLGMDAISATPNWKEKPISMVDPAQRENLIAEVQKNIDVAVDLEVPMLLLMSGLELPGMSREEQRASLVEGCKRCADLAVKADVTLVVEPLNSRIETPGFFLTTCKEGLEVIKEVDHPHVRLLFDIYHEQVQTGNVIDTIKAAADLTEIFHVADNPGRHEPGTGEIYYPNVYRAIKETGYRGYIAMEYLPTSETVSSLTRSVDEMRAAIA